jgi:hypothetical protein
MKFRYIFLGIALTALFVIADHVRGAGLHALGAVLDIAKLLVCAALIAPAWHRGLRALAILGVVMFALTA